jgi:hypothetical protein
VPKRAPIFISNDGVNSPHQLLITVSDVANKPGFRFKKARETAAFNLDGHAGESLAAILVKATLSSEAQHAA